MQLVVIVMADWELIASQTHHSSVAAVAALERWVAVRKVLLFKQKQQLGQATALRH